MTMQDEHKPHVSAHDLRFVPQCAAISVALSALEITIEVLTAAHPALRDRQDFRYYAPEHVDSIADIAILQAQALVETLVRYQLLALNPRADLGEEDCQ